MLHWRPSGGIPLYKYNVYTCWLRHLDHSGRLCCALLVGGSGLLPHLLLVDIMRPIYCPASLLFRIICIDKLVQDKICFENDILRMTFPVDVLSYALALFSNA